MSNDGVELCVGWGGVGCWWWGEGRGSGSLRNNQKDTCCNYYAYCRNAGKLNKPIMKNCDE